MHSTTKFSEKVKLFIIGLNCFFIVSMAGFSVLVGNMTTITQA